MSSNILRSTALAIAIAGSLVQASAFAQATPAAGATATAPAKAESASLLAGKLKFALPPGFVGSALPPGSASDGTAGATGTIYVNQATEQVVLNTEAPVPGGARVGDDDKAFLDRTVADFSAQQQKALPDYEKHGEKSMTIKGLGLRQADASATFGGAKTRSTTLIAGSGNTMALVRVMSKAEDTAGHNILVSQVVDAIKNSR
jgi:hypothetical protein